MLRRALSLSLTLLNTKFWLKVFKNFQHIHVYDDLVSWHLVSTFAIITHWCIQNSVKHLRSSALQKIVNG